MEELQNVTGVQVEDNTPDYLAAIQELKQNSVDRTKYDELRAENKRLINSIVNGQDAGVEVTKEKKDINKLRQELFHPTEDLSNLDFAKKTLELREALIENGEGDFFLPIGTHISPTAQDIESAERVAEVLQQCIDYADGDSSLFTSELDRRTVDVNLPIRKKR